MRYRNSNRHINNQKLVSNVSFSKIVSVSVFSFVLRQNLQEAIYKSGERSESDKVFHVYTNLWLILIRLLDCPVRGHLY